MSVQTSPGVAALGTPEPTGEVSDGAALLRAGRFTTPHAQCQSNRRAHGGPSARPKRVMQTTWCGTKATTWEGKIMVSVMICK